jgi:general secretion pathway protein I
VNARHSRGFTLVEVLVALVVVALGLTALMVAVSGTARTSGYLRDKTIAQWIALNRITEVRLMVNKLGDNHDTGEVQFANRKWHYDTRYFQTNFPSMQRIVVRIYAGDAKTKGNPIVETTSFFGTDLGTPGMSNVDWTVGSTMATANPCTTNPVAGTTGTGTATSTATGTINNTTSNSNGTSSNCVNSGTTSGVPTTVAPTTTTPGTTTTPQGQTTP